MERKKVALPPLGSPSTAATDIVLQLSRTFFYTLSPLSFFILESSSDLSAQ